MHLLGDIESVPVGAKHKSETAACIASNVRCQRHSAFLRRNFHSRSIRFRLGEYAGSFTTRNCGLRRSHCLTTALL
jgi:hypothetical protein